MNLFHLIALAADPYVLGGGAALIALIVLMNSIRAIGPTQVGLARTCDRRHLIKVSREEIPNVDVVLSLRPPKLA